MNYRKISSLWYKRKCGANYAQNPIYDQSLLIAEGLLLCGENGEINFLVDIHKEKPIIMEDGGVNYRDLDYIVSVQDQKVCGVTPPTPGINGKNVLGTV